MEGLTPTNFEVINNQSKITMKHSLNSRESYSTPNSKSFMNVGGKSLKKNSAASAKSVLI